MENERTRKMMTRDFKQTVVSRVKKDPAFAQALLDETRILISENDTLRTALEVIHDSLKPGQNAAGLYYLTPSSAKVVENALKLSDELRRQAPAPSPAGRRWGMKYLLIVAMLAGTVGCGKPSGPTLYVDNGYVRVRGTNHAYLLVPEEDIKMFVADNTTSGLIISIAKTRSSLIGAMIILNNK